MGPVSVDDFLEVGSNELVTGSAGKESNFEIFPLVKSEGNGY